MLAVLSTISEALQPWSFQPWYEIYFNKNACYNHMVLMHKFKVGFRVAMKFHQGNSRIIQGSFCTFQGCSNWVKLMINCCVGSIAAPIWRISMRCIALSPEFRDFKDLFKSSRTFQGFQGWTWNSRISRILSRMWQPWVVWISHEHEKIRKLCTKNVNIHYMA